VRLWVPTLALVLAGCGLDGLFFTPRGFDESSGPTTVVAGQTQAGATLVVLGADGRVIANGQADDAGKFELVLPSGQSFSNLRLFARGDAGDHKSVIAELPAGSRAELGVLSARTTSFAQLLSYEIQDQAGSSFLATPPAAVRGLLSELNVAPTPALAALVAAVEALGPFALQPEGASLTADVDPNLAEAYRAALAAAAEGYAIRFRCDPSRLATMFTVDLSGQAKDGNGAPQRIRQQPKEARVFLGYTSDESSPVVDDTIPNKLTPNDPTAAMVDDGTQGDEVAGDRIYTVVVPLPRGARILYKYTNGAAGEGFTGTEEWPGNARIIQIEDVLTGRPDGEPDCLVVRRDAFGDEASNKNFVNLNAVARARGGSLPYEGDLGGAAAPRVPSGLYVGGLDPTGPRAAGSLTPAGVPEARENGVCTVCPAPLILDPDDRIAPELLGAERTAVDRVTVHFSEPLAPSEVAGVEHWLYLDDAGRAIAVLEARPSGADVLLRLEPTHPRNPARLRVRDLADASVAANRLSEAEVEVGPDETAPTLLSVRSLSILELDPDVRPADPTVGDLVELVFDERPEPSAAGDPARYQIPGLVVVGAVLVPESTVVRLSTEPQGKDRPYALELVGLRDPAGNAVTQQANFNGFGLYRVTFGFVPGFAYASGDGLTRGLPRDEQLYLTGTPLLAAYELDGRPLSVARQGTSRTDVTGFPDFELVPGARQHAGQPIYERTVLLPKGSWAYKAAHGVPDDRLRPPPTLEKVYKTLATTNDGSGVRIDPSTMLASNGTSYVGARLSANGDEPPRSNVVFKREAPDEVCEVYGDTVCPFVVIGTWRDLVVEQGGRARDYDDGLPPLSPHRPGLPDTTPPLLLEARARDSYSLLLSFDESLAMIERLEVELAGADDRIGLPVRVVPTSELRPHQTYVEVNAADCATALQAGRAYTLRYRGARNPAGLVDRQWRTQSLLAPGECTPKTPLTDRTPPRIRAVQATDLGELLVQFDERLDPARVVPAAFGVARRSNGAALTVNGAEVRPDKRTVRLTTETQSILEPYRLTVQNLLDAADPANTLTSTAVDFVGFGERQAPQLLRARAADPTHLVLRFDEPMEATSVLEASRYTILGLEIRGVAFSGDPGRRNLAFNPELAPRIRDLVVLETAPMTAGQSYTVEIAGVRDLSGNSAQLTANFVGVAEAAQIQVVLEYQVSDTIGVGGNIPSRALSLAELSDAREGVFILGARASADHTPVAGREGPINQVLFGFGVEGQPLDGLEPRLLDNGAAPDQSGGDGVYTITIPGVPLGSTMIWKAFAPFSTGYRDRSPQDAQAAFADPLPGPSVFGDGQEYPGNENGAVIWDDGDGDGVVRIRCLFGDEVTYKKGSGTPAYVWIGRDQATE
jgi:hypothetical protein